jgi:hypothetical protein
MRRLSTTFRKPPGTAAAFHLFFLSSIFIVTATLNGFAQCDGCTASSAASVLGVHSNGGRECASCHAPHTASLVAGPGGTEPGAAAAAAGAALWGHNASPSYGPTVSLGDAAKYVEVVPAGVASPSEEVIGILLCLSCHDGNLTPQTMMPSQSYARKMGLLGDAGGRSIPTLLTDGLRAGDSAVDHPLGTDATITLTDGLVFTNRVFSVVPGTPYARFMANYGLPVLAPGNRSAPYGVNQDGKPYLLCTTCHNQHLGAAFPSTRTNPIGGDGGGRVYSTYFFVNGPYDPKFDTVPSTRAAPTAQFCRQCHMDLANEGNNSLNIRTAFY